MRFATMNVIRWFIMVYLCKQVLSYSSKSRLDPKITKQGFQARNAVVSEQDDLARRSFLKDLSTLSLGLVSVASFSSKPVLAMTNDLKTGTSLPDLGEIEASIPKDWSDVDNPFLDGDVKTMFSRLDSTPDSLFYSDPRFVEHIDDNAVRLITNYISNDVLGNRQDLSVLDLCSSWTSHIDASGMKSTQRIVGLGMNEKELKANPVLNDWTIQDLNQKPNLPYDDESFDVVLCQLSIDYLTKPMEVLKDVSRILKPNGTVHIIFSNRLFLSKAVGLWTGADDLDHAYYVSCYLHFCNGKFQNIAARDLSTRKKQRIIGDPLYVVSASKV